MGIHKRRDTNKWQAYYRDPSGRQRSKDFALKRDAVRWEASKRRDIDRGEWIDPEQARTTVGAIWAPLRLPPVSTVAPAPRASSIHDSTRRAAASSISVPTSVSGSSGSPNFSFFTSSATRALKASNTDRCT